MEKEKLEQIKEKIRTINPAITDELFDLLYEYIMCKYVVDFKENVNPTDFQNVINYMMNPLDFKKSERN